VCVQFSEQCGTIFSLPIRITPFLGGPSACGPEKPTVRLQRPPHPRAQTGPAPRAPPRADRPSPHMAQRKGFFSLVWSLYRSMEAVLQSPEHLRTG
jgi:hypothetical protein